MSQTTRKYVINDKARTIMHAGANNNLIIN